MVLVDQRTNDGEGKQHMEFLFSGQTKVTKECQSQACLAQRHCMFLCGCSLTKISLGVFFCGLAGALETTKFNHPQKFVPIWYAKVRTHFQLYAVDSVNSFNLLLHNIGCY